MKDSTHEDEAFAEGVTVELNGLRFHRVEHYENATVVVTTREDVLDYLQNLRAKKLPADNNGR